MRLGILSFGPDRHEHEAILGDSLRARDMDVVEAESAVYAAPDAAREARRLARADCDGIVFLVADDDGGAAAARGMAEAALHVTGTPLLVAAGRPGPSLFTAAGVLEEIGAPYDRLAAQGAEVADAVFLWLRENAKTERQRGLEAVRKLYGQRLFVPADAPAAAVDPALWMHQFGVAVTRSEAEAPDFAAGDGDVLGALTDRLLELVSGTATSEPVPVAPATGGATQEGDTPATFARLSRHAGRFRCLIARGTLRADGVTVAEWAVPYERLAVAAVSPWLHAVPGEHVGALRAACESLGVEAMILRQ